MKFTNEINFEQENFHKVRVLKTLVLDGGLLSFFFAVFSQFNKKKIQALPS